MSCNHSYSIAHRVNTLRGHISKLVFLTLVHFLDQTIKDRNMKFFWNYLNILSIDLERVFFNICICVCVRVCESAFLCVFHASITYTQLCIAISPKLKRNFKKTLSRFLNNIFK